MSKLQVNDLIPVNDSLALIAQINDLTEDQAENIMGGGVKITVKIGGVTIIVEF